VAELEVMYFDPVSAFFIFGLVILISWVFKTQ